MIAEQIICGYLCLIFLITVLLRLVLPKLNEVLVKRDDLFKKDQDACFEIQEEIERLRIIKAEKLTLATREAKAWVDGNIKNVTQEMSRIIAREKTLSDQRLKKTQSTYLSLVTETSFSNHEIQQFLEPVFLTS